MWEEQKCPFTKTSGDTDVLRGHLYKVKFNSQRRHWALWSVLYPSANNNTCRHVDTILVNSKSPTKMVIYEYGYDYQDNLPWWTHHRPLSNTGRK